MLPHVVPLTHHLRPQPLEPQQTRPRGFAAGHTHLVVQLVPLPSLLSRSSRPFYIIHIIPIFRHIFSSNETMAQLAQLSHQLDVGPHVRALSFALIETRLASPNAGWARSIPYRETGKNRARQMFVCKHNVQCILIHLTQDYRA